MNQYYYQMKSPIGPLSLFANETHLNGLYLEKQNQELIGERKRTAILANAEEQLDLYFAKKLISFDLPILLVGTDFQKQVWAELRRIEFGETMSYSQHATRIKRPRAVRAVGTAIGKNPLSIIVPCHRVVSASGAPGGYAGGCEEKKWLLRHESSICDRLGRARMSFEAKFSYGI